VAERRFQDLLAADDLSPERLALQLCRIEVLGTIPGTTRLNNTCDPSCSQLGQLIQRHGRAAKACEAAYLYGKHHPSNMLRWGYSSP